MENQIGLMPYNDFKEEINQSIKTILLYICFGCK